MRTSRPILTFCTSPASTSIWLQYSSYANFGVVFAHSDGVNWTAAYDLRPRLPKSTDLGCSDLYRPNRATVMPVEAQALFAWLADLKLHEQPLGTKRERPRPEMDPVVSDVVGSTAVVYQGYGKKLGEYDFAKIRAIVTKAVELCLKTWGWAPETVRFSLHSDGRAMGMAFMPGAIDGTKARRVSLHRVLFRKYDANAIHRVVVHELCHHFREERWPRKRSQISDGHDAKFCEQLQLVDPIVATNPTQCQFFEEQADPTVLAALAQKREAGVVWSPDAGTLVVSRLKSGEVRLAWEPVTPGLWKVTKNPLNDTTLLALIQRFAPAQWKDVRATGYWRDGGATLAELLGAWLRAWPSAFQKTRAYVQSLAPSA